MNNPIDRVTNIPDVKLTPKEKKEVVFELIQNPDLYEVNTALTGYLLINDLEKALDKNEPWYRRVQYFIAGESKLSRGLGSVLDFITIFVPYGNKINNVRDAIKMIVGRKQKQKEKPMLKKILSIKNLINVRDELGRLSMEEIIASVVQLAIAAALVWALVQLGIFEPFMEFVNGGE